MSPHPRFDGDGWTRCELDHKHWGLHGAAGLLIHRAMKGGGAREGGGTGAREGAGTEVLLQHRAEWSHHGGTWGLLGGARHSDEDAIQASLREAAEESGLEPSGLRVDGVYVDDHGGWSYSTVIAEATGDVTTAALNEETVAVAWWRVEEVGGGLSVGGPGGVGTADRAGELSADARPLHPGFAASWPTVRQGLVPVRIVVDAANVVGSRPDGWWRDRAGAAERLLARCAGLASRGVAGSALEAALPGQVLQRTWPRLSVVVEGAARAAPRSGADTSPRAAMGTAVEVVRAPRSGDDALVEHVAALTSRLSVAGSSGAGSSGAVLVVTADRELRRRCEALGATAIGPRWLLDLFDVREG